MRPFFEYKKARLYQADCLDWLAQKKAASVHGVVTDPPYGLVEYSPEQQEKLWNGNGGVWRLPPAYDGHNGRTPLPRFTTLSPRRVDLIGEFFQEWGEELFPVLVPGAHVFVATTPVVSYAVADALMRAGFERRGEVIRLFQTLRGGDRPKGAHRKYSEVSVIPRSQHEPWLLFRKPFEGRVRDNLNRWWTGALRRPEEGRPFGDVIRSWRASAEEREIADHPSLKPQAFLRLLVHAVLPLGMGVILDPFAGSGSTLAAAQAMGLNSIGVEIDNEYCRMARQAIPALARLSVPVPKRRIRASRARV